MAGTAGPPARLGNRPTPVNECPQDDRHTTPNLAQMRPVIVPPTRTNAQLWRPRAVSDCVPSSGVTPADAIGPDHRHIQSERLSHRRMGRLGRRGQAPRRLPCLPVPPGRDQRTQGRPSRCRLLAGAAGRGQGRTGPPGSCPTSSDRGRPAQLAIRHQESRWSFPGRRVCKSGHDPCPPPNAATSDICAVSALKTFQSSREPEAEGVCPWWASHPPDTTDNGLRCRSQAWGALRFPQKHVSWSWVSRPSSCRDHVLPSHCKG